MELERELEVRREPELELDTEPEPDAERPSDAAGGRKKPPDGINLGCGDDHLAGLLNVDYEPAVDPDVVCDLNETPWPWDDGQFTLIVARHVLEHLDPVPWDELARIAAPGATVVITYPFGHTRFEDPTHKQFWNYNTAEALAGGRSHPHAAPLPFEFDYRDVRWWVGNGGRWYRWLVAALVRLWGVGPWLEQVPGVYGEVEAVYRA